MKATIDSLFDFLSKEGYQPKKQPETDQVYTVFIVHGHMFPLFFKLLEEGNLIQMIAFIPPNIVPRMVNDLSRFLHLLNKELDLPGFGIDEQAKISFYRLMLPTLDQEVNTQLLKIYIKAVEMVLNQSARSIISLGTGEESYGSILKKLEETHERLKQKA